ncbi:MAG: CPBP family intramembrane metalloprotease [Flavobacteriaceae bacterium]|nr:CPBP family intramembrane metalloprotease [Flavobacteriaceae bacterium]
MFISQVYKGVYEGWKYILGFFVVFVIGAQVIGAIPFGIAVIMKSIKDEGDFNMSSLDDIYTLFESNTTLALMLIPFAVGMVILFFWMKYIHKQSFVSLTTARKKIDFKRVFFAFGLWATVVIAMTLIDYQLSPENYQWNFDLQKFSILLAIAIVLVPIQTSFEEYIFRGYLMQGIGAAAKNKWVPLVVTSLIFGLMHIANPEVEKIGYIIMVYYIGTGFFLGIITLMDEGMELALGFHAANNLVTALLVTANWTAFQTNSILKDMSEPAAGYDVLVPVLVIFPILLFIFSKKYQWNNWTEKLTGKVINPLEINVISKLGEK